MSNKNLTIVVALVAIIAIGGYFYPQLHGVLGAISSDTNYPFLSTAGLKVGPNCGDSSTSGSATNCQQIVQHRFSFPSCTALNPSGSQQAGNFSFAAGTTTMTVECTVPNAQAGDTVIAQMTSRLPGWDQTRLASGGQFSMVGLQVESARASSTSGFVDVEVTSFLGVATSSLVIASSSIAVEILR